MGSDIMVVVMLYSPPQIIVVLLSCRYIYWTDWGTEAKIEKASLQGKNRRAIITTNVHWPNGLTIDHTLKRLYWIDAKLKTIETCDFNGRNRVVVRKLAFTSHPFSISVFEDNIYWTDWDSGAVEVANKFNGTNRGQVIQSHLRLLGVKVVHQALQLPGSVLMMCTMGGVCDVLMMCTMGGVCDVLIMCTMGGVCDVLMMCTMGGVCDVLMMCTMGGVDDVYHGWCM